MGPVKLKKPSWALCKCFPRCCWLCAFFPLWLTPFLSAPPSAGFSSLVLSLTSRFPFGLFLFLWVATALLARLVAPMYAILFAGSSHVLESKLNTSSWQPVFSLNIFPGKRCQHHICIRNLNIILLSLSLFDQFFSMTYLRESLASRNKMKSPWTT